MFILGISAFYHDSAAAIVRDGTLVAAAQEERFSRVKHDASFPLEAIRFCLQEAEISLSQCDYVVFYEKPFIKFERLVETFVAMAPAGLKLFLQAMPIWLKDKLFQKRKLTRLLRTVDGYAGSIPIKFTEHHFSHAASAFYPSPFDKAIVITLDGVGEWATTTIALGDNSSLRIMEEQNFPHSIGLLYSAFTYYIGFRVNSGEYKLMGLAPYGEPKYAELIKKYLIKINEDGSFWIDQSYFNYCSGLTMTNTKFEELFGFRARAADIDPITEFHMDIAASIQLVTEEIILKIAKYAKNSYQIDYVCLAGGVALNCVANGKLRESKIFSHMWVQPAAGDAGGAIGAALGFWHQELSHPKQKVDTMFGSYLGPSFDQESVNAELSNSGAIFSVMSERDMLKATASALAEGLAVGWFAGRMEFGPRALGCRSILGDPRSADMQRVLNLKVKYRESFRPFAPAILAEDVDDWFEFCGDSPYMLQVASVRQSHCFPMNPEQEALFGIDKLNVIRSTIPAVTHVDYSARIQTVDDKTNPLFYKLLKEFKRLTGCPVLINTSFNVRGEPIVCTPKDAFDCFMGTGLDLLVCEKAVCKKEDQNRDLIRDYSSKFDLD